MKTYRYITTVKAKDPQGKKPTHYLKAKENQGDQDGVFVASLWSKSAEVNGETKKWLSGEMKASWTNQTNPEENREGYVIVSERELNALLKKVEQDEDLGDIQEEDTIDPEDIPF